MSFPVHWSVILSPTFKVLVIGLCYTWQQISRIHWLYRSHTISSHSIHPPLGSQSLKLTITIINNIMIPPETNFLTPLSTLHQHICHLWAEPYSGTLEHLCSPSSGLLFLMTISLSVGVSWIVAPQKIGTSNVCMQAYLGRVFADAINLRILKWDHPRLSGYTLNPMTRVLAKRKVERHLGHTEEKATWRQM